MENKSSTAPSFNIKNIHSDLNKPAITLCHHSGDNFSVSFSVIPSMLQSCTILFTATLLVLKESLKSPSFFFLEVSLW